MILYNVTIKIDTAIHQEWLQWMRAEHIPAVMNTGCFESHRVCKLMTEEEDGVTYAIQYFCKDLPTYFRYQENYAPALQAETATRYKDRFVAFRTLLEILD